MSRLFYHELHLLDNMLIINTDTVRIAKSLPNPLLADVQQWLLNNSYF
jgi:hypothetical protein